MSSSVCCSCDDEILSEDSWEWSNVYDKPICDDCSEQDKEHASIVLLVDNDILTTYYIGEYLRIDEDGEFIEGLEFEREWISPERHAGFYETTIDGWTEVLCGWTTNSWGDEISDKKQIFNNWVSTICEEGLPAATKIAIISDPTSNIFSMGISVVALDSDIFKQYLGSEITNLQNSLD